MILIVIPTLDPDRGQETGRRAQLSAAYDTRLVVVHDETGQGFTKTVNQGIQQRNPGEDVCLLNDDIERFNYGWLKVLHKALHSDRRRGIVGPSGKCASPTRHGKLGDTGIQSINMLPFWCVVIKSTVIDRLGYLDEQFIHYSSDTWYCHQARTKGWQVMWVKSVFLNHTSGSSGFHAEWRAHDTAVFRKLAK